MANTSVMTSPQGEIESSSTSVASPSNTSVIVQVFDTLVKQFPLWDKDTP